MLLRTKEILKEIEKNNFKAYIVGGFVRDYYLGKESKDVDICTNATSAELAKIFPNVKLNNKQYGTVRLDYKNIHFEITTFRKEKRYKEARKPLKIKYIQNLKKDLKRRDFTMNSLCLNKEEELIDYFNGLEDINKKIIRCIGNPNKKLKEDALRILRAIRFVSTLGFDIEHKTLNALKRNRKNLKKLSYQRRKEELNKIFIGKYSKKALTIINDLNLNKYLELGNIDNLVLIPDIIGIWVQLDINATDWGFKKTEKQMIIKIKDLLKKEEIDDYTLYKNGLYISEITYKIKRRNVKELSKRHRELPIKRIKDINISSEEICELLNRETGPIIKEVYNDLEKQIVNKKIENNKKIIKEYIIKKYL